MKKQNKKQNDRPIDEEEDVDMGRGNVSELTCIACLGSFDITDGYNDEFCCKRCYLDYDEEDIN